MRKTNKAGIRSLAEELAKEFPEGAIVALYGELGAGKTTFAKALAGCVGLPEEEVTSPTYTYMHLYDNFVHFDLWRLNGPEEFIAQGFEEYLHGKGWVVIEWPSRIESLLPESVVRIELC